MARASGRGHRATFAVLLAGVATFALLQSFATPVLPTIQRSLHTSQSTVTWVLTAYLLSASICTPILGRVGDIAGKERVFVATLLTLAAGSLLAALASSVGVLIAARVVQGVGGGVLPLTFGIIRDEFPEHLVSGAIGVAAALAAVGAGVGIVLAGPIVTGLNYHWLFWIPLIITVVTAVAAHLVVPESPIRTPGRINWRSALALSGWLLALLVALSKGDSWGWTSAKVLGLLGVAAVLLAVWLLVELTAHEPLVDMRMLAIPTVWRTNLVSLLAGVGMYSMYAFVPDFVQTPSSAGYGFGATQTASGIFVLPLTLTMFVFGILSGSLSRRFGTKTVLVIGTAVSVAPCALLAFAHDAEWQISLALGSSGIALGLVFATMSNLVVDAVPYEQTGVASGMNANIRTVGGAIGAAMMTSVVGAGVASNAIPKESGYTHGFLALGVAACLATVAALAVPAHHRRFRASAPRVAALAEP